MWPLEQFCINRDTFLLAKISNFFVEKFGQGLAVPCVFHLESRYLTSTKYLLDLCRALLAIVLLLMSVNSLGRTVSYEEIRGDLFGTIQSIEKCGSYAYDGNYGDYRLIHAYVYGANMLFVDEVKIETINHHVVAGYTFDELNNDHLELNIQNVECSATQDRVIKVKGKVNGTGHDERAVYNFLIILDLKTGKYTYEKI